MKLLDGINQYIKDEIQKFFDNLKFAFETLTFLHQSLLLLSDASRHEEDLHCGLLGLQRLYVFFVQIDIS